MRLIDPKKIPKMGEPTTLEDAPMYEFAQCLIDYLVENYGVDVPDIVRCKDCKWYRNRFDQHYCCLSAIDCPLPDDYCSRAERKNEVDNG